MGRASELAILDDAWANPKTSILQIVALGGVGKTQLVKKWQENLLDRHDHGGAVRAYDWSFYSQGTKQQASADDFFDRALRWFGEAEPENYKDPWAKGERLAELVKQRRTLLILDGMEPLQHPPGPMAGELTDPSIQTLLEGLQRDNPGLCIVTTRVPVPTLDEMSEPKRRTIDLGHLSPEAGADLLQRYGVTGDPEELLRASADVKGHALALILLGTYLKLKCHGDVAQHSEALLFQGHERYAAHAHKVMASYEAWFEGQDDTGRAAVAILRLMGLFNRPADAGCLAALRAEPAIPGLTEPLFARDDRDELWTRAVERLRAARLLADDDSSTDNLQLKTEDSLDAHPLVKEHFAAQLAEQLPDAAREAHRRLYEHLKSVPKDDLPDNLNDMMPLYHAVAHGCKAGLHDDAANAVYYGRIQRHGQYFSMRKLGLFGSDLTALSYFFEDTWNKPSEKLTDAAQRGVLAVSAFVLQALGRLAECKEPNSLAMRQYTRLRKWNHAAAVASNLSRLSLTLGDVSSAVRQGEQSVELADRSSDTDTQLLNRTMLAGALHASARGLAGCRSHEAALVAFRESEAMQAEREPQNPLLYSLQGYLYCDLLLDEFSVVSCQLSAKDSAPSIPNSAIARLREVRNRAEEMVRENPNLGHVSIALHHLALGRTNLLEGVLETKNKQLETRDRYSEIEEGSALESAGHHLGKTVSLLLQSGMKDELPRGLLHRAALWRVKYEITKDKSQIDLAERDLIEAERIARRGSMLIWRIETALERTRLALMLGEKKQAKEKLEETRELIRQTEKPYVPHIPDWADWDPPDYIGVFAEGDIVGYHRRNPEIEALQQAID